MKLYINMPTSNEGKKIFNKAFSKLQTFLLLKTIDDLELSNNSKNKVLLSVINELEKEISKV